jgi:acyl-CoA hydrolase
MKMMDNVAGMVAFRHAHCNIVTASIGKINLYFRCIFNLQSMQ